MDRILAVRLLYQWLILDENLEGTNIIGREKCSWRNGYYRWKEYGDVSSDHILLKGMQRQQVTLNTVEVK